jgi:hypothetical protein
MADYGLIVRNNKRVIVIDSTYKNYSYYQGDTTTLAQYTNTISINSTQDKLITVFKPVTTSYINSYGIGYDGTSFNSVYIASDSSCNCDWIVYKDGPSTTTGDYGLIVYDSTGDICFNSNETGYLRPLYRYSYSSITYGYYEDIVVEDADNNYFLLIGGNGIISANGSTYTIYILGLKKIDSTTLRISYLPIKTGPSTESAFAANISGPNYVFEFKPPLA